MTYKHTINFQIDDQFKMSDLRAISSKKYSGQIDWYISMSKMRGYAGWPLTHIIKDLTCYIKRLNINDTKTVPICKVDKVEEDYNYLRVYLRCIHPDIESYLLRPDRFSGKPLDKDDLIPEYTKEQDEYWEHMSEFHGWNRR